MTARTHYKRRKRRQANMVLRSGGKFNVRHARKSGRTGRSMSERNRPVLNNFFPLPQQCSHCGFIRKCGDPGHCPYGIGNA